MQIGYKILISNFNIFNYHFRDKTPNTSDTNKNNPYIDTSIYANDFVSLKLLETKNINCNIMIAITTIMTLIKK